MKDSIKILDPVQSIIALTEKLEKKKKFAYVNISRSAINVANNSAEKKPSKYFAKALNNCLKLQDENFLKAIPVEFSKDIENGSLTNIGLPNTGTYYDAAMFEYFFSNKKDVVDIFINHYIKDSKNVILTFHDKKIVEKVFGHNQYIINVPYNNYYDKLDSITAQIKEFSNGVDAVILDCPLLATAIAPKIWENTDISIVDFGKVVSSAKFSFHQERNKTFNKEDNFKDKKKFKKNRYEKR